MTFPHIVRSILTTLLLSQFLFGSWDNSAPDLNREGERVWGTKPVLSYFALTPSLVIHMREGAGLGEPQFQEVQGVARLESYELQKLIEKSAPIIQDAQTPLWVKKLRIWLMGFNPKVDEIVRSSDQLLQERLVGEDYKNLVAWIEARWKIERQLHGQLSPQSSPRTYSIYATRYDSGGAYRVALPDKCLKFANGGSHICDSDGYLVGANYTVFLSYQSGTAAIVGEAGPWNVDDNYWSLWNDPQPRRMFADLALGIPEAQAAYFNGYNGGADQFGRKVTAPFGIDLARQVSIDIGLQPGVNDWITVTFPWTDGWGGGGAPGTTGGTGATGATALAIIPVQVASPQPDGSIIHLVEYGQTLWEIAVTYEVGLQTLYQLNGLSEDDVIWIGQELLVRPPGSITPGLTNTPIGTPEPSESPKATRTPDRRTATALAFAGQATETALLGEVLTEMQETTVDDNKAISPSMPQGFDIWLVVGVVLVAAGFLLWLGGRWLKRG